MKQIIAVLGAAIAINKGLNIMTENSENKRDLWFRLFRAVFWFSLSSTCVLGVFWLAKQVF